MEAIVFIDGVIDTDPQSPEGQLFGICNLANIREQIAKYPNFDSLRVYINSPGGSTSEGFAIFDFLKLQAVKITTVAIGTCASMGTVIFMAGDERVISPRTDFMIHCPRGGVQGTADEIEMYYKSIRETENQMLDTYEAETGMKREDILSMLQKETFLSAQDAVRYGFATRIMGDEATALYERAMPEVSTAQKEARQSSPITKETRKQLEIIALVDKLSIQGAITPAMISQAYNDFYASVNMSYAEYENWANSDCSKMAGGSGAVKTRMLEMLNINKPDWTAKHYRWAQQITGFIGKQKALAADGEPVVSNGKTCGTKVGIMLKNRGFNPAKAEKTAFNPSSKIGLAYEDRMHDSLSYKRKDMPQIPKEMQDAFEGYFKAKYGADSIEKGTMPVGMLKPTQCEMDPAKVQQKSQSADWKNRDYIIAQDNHLLDGHHDWAAGLEADPNAKVKYTKVKMPIDSLISEANKMKITTNEPVKSLKSQIKQFIAMKGNKKGMAGLFASIAALLINEKVGVLMLNTDDGTQLYINNDQPDGIPDVGDMVFSDEAMTLPAADGSYTLDSGMEITVIGGTISEVEGDETDPSTQNGAAGSGSADQPQPTALETRIAALEALVQAQATELTAMKSANAQFVTQTAFKNFKTGLGNQMKLISSNIEIVDDPIDNVNNKGVKNGTKDSNAGMKAAADAMRKKAGLLN